MCGRYRLKRLDLPSLFDVLAQDPFEEFSERGPQYNIAPTQHIPIVRVNSKGERVLTLARWGFIPWWAKEPPKPQPINARAETVQTSGMFRKAFASGRCLIPADGFYEWQGKKPPKQPYFIHRKDDGVFAFAGLWERWRPREDAEPVDTVTIITTTPNTVMEPIHNRMPVIIDRSDYDTWLDRRSARTRQSSFSVRHRTIYFEAYRVSTRVNKPENQGPELLEPVKE